MSHAHAAASAARVPFEFFSSEFLHDPYPHYRWLRENDAIHWSDELRAWVVSRYDDVTTLLTDERITADRVTPRFLQLPPDERERFAAFAERMRMWMLLLDNPEHGRLRRLVNTALAGHVVKTFRPTIAGLLVEMLADQRQGGRMEFISELAYPLPLYVVSTILGIPPRGRAKAKRCAVAIANFVGAPLGLYSERIAAAKAEVDDISEYIRGILHCRRSQPQSDFLTALLAAEDESQVMNEEEILATCVMMIFAGFETTMNLLGNGLWTLFRHPEALEALRRDADLIPDAVAEMLRYESPVQRLSRMATEDIEIKGRRIGKGELVFLLIGSANRDPDVFADPDTFDITRDNRRQMGFGFNIHRCPGSTLARLEGSMVFTELMQRFSDIRPVRQHVEWEANLSVRQLKTLHIDLTPA